MWSSIFSLLSIAFTKQNSLTYATLCPVPKGGAETVHINIFLSYISSEVLKVAEKAF